MHWCVTASAQSLTLPAAIDAAWLNYGTLKAKLAYAEASKQVIAQSRRDYLPNLSAVAQQDYGTVNGQNGPLYGFGGLGVASSGLPLAAQNWNAAFGALYLANFNWDFFSFGRAAEKVHVAQAAYRRDSSDWSQERFRQAVQVAATYLNLLAAKRLRMTQERNVDRAQVVRMTAVARAAGGLLPGVDSVLANAELSGARIALAQALDAEQSQEQQLAVLTGMTMQSFILDTSLLQHIPEALQVSDLPPGDHPVLRYYASRLRYSQQQLSYIRKQAYPVFSLFGVFQGRGSGFEAGYTQDQRAFSQDYLQGIRPVRSNYLVGAGVSWNLSAVWRVQAQAAAQRLVAAGQRDELELAGQQIEAQQQLAAGKMQNALTAVREVPIQLQSARAAYVQKSTLYRNGLANQVDLTQALYTLNRAETDRDIAYANVWQALLLKAAATGDLSLFLNEL